MAQGRRHLCPEQGSPARSPMWSLGTKWRPGVVLRALVNSRDEYFQRLESPAPLAWRRPSRLRAPGSSAFTVFAGGPGQWASEAELTISESEGLGDDRQKGTRHKACGGDGAPHLLSHPEHTLLPENPARTSNLRVLGAQPMVPETERKGMQRGAQGPEVFSTPPPPPPPDTSAQGLGVEERGRAWVRPCPRQTRSRGSLVLRASATRQAERRWHPLWTAAEAPAAGGGVPTPGAGCG